MHGASSRDHRHEKFRKEYTLENRNSWQFWIDVGGTFTDVVARTPAGQILTHKTLSSGWVKGCIDRQWGECEFSDPHRRHDPDHLWRGYRFRLRDRTGHVCLESTLIDSRAEGRLYLRHALPPDCVGLSYELTSGEPAPIVGMRYLLGMPVDVPIPAARIRLGTTRGTNALLERRGARTLFVTTAGFEDCLLIGNQSRPRLFDLTIEKSPPLYERVLGIEERLDAEGNVLRNPDPERVLEQLRVVREAGIDAVAICLLHAYRNPAHELLVEDCARQAGFGEISVSHRLCPLIKLISRGDTTLLNAYLNPVLKDYLSEIRSCVPDSQLELMTSAGGLMPASQFLGKDSILSGPAGGVVGAARVAVQAGFPRAIGFDMGGTSTDVSRFEGACELEYETEKAGVRIATPILNIETVAAGGGSLCRFDGVRLLVGPESAGAEPGPCCYGSDGPLTVTDMNVFTGRILPEYFPFPLDVAAVESKLRAVCRELELSPLGRKLTPRELAEGFLEIANTRMARAIARISSARGFDPAEHVLVTFGGAGGQHACALARELGIRKVMIHPLAGVLSAYGIGQAVRRQHAERAVLRLLRDISPEELTGLFADLTTQARQEGGTEWAPPTRGVTMRCSLDLRYLGRETTLNVVADTHAGFQHAYEQEHRRRFGFLHEQFPLEVAAARVELAWEEAASEPALTETPLEFGTSEPGVVAPLRETVVFWGRREITAGIYSRTQLRPGCQIQGPAILHEETSTIFLEPGCQARVLPRGEILIDIPPRASNEDPPCGTRDTNGIDPVSLEIFHHHFASIAEQMGETLRQTAHSVNVKERLDYSCAVFDPQGELVANAPHIPVHLGAMSETVKSILAEHPVMRPGDVFVTNDPYRGGSHLPDVTVVSPLVSSENGQLLALVAARAHHAEIGGITPGSMPPFSTCLSEEGVVIRNLALVEAGTPRFDELRKLLSSGPYPSRSVSENIADIQAQLAANRLGLALLQQLVQSQTVERTHRYMKLIRAASAEKTRQALQAYEGARRSFTDYLDEGAPITVTMEIQSGCARIDFSGTGPVLSSNLNANRAITTAAVIYVLRCLIGVETPLNGGLLEPVEIVLPRCLLNPPSHEDPARCAAMVGGNVETSQRVVDVLLGALELAAASQGTMNNLTFGNASFGYYETICGGSGATPRGPGCDAVHTHMTNTRLTDVEVLETRYPVRLRKFALRHKSGGTGLHSGGNGIVRELEFLAPLSVSMLSQRRGSHVPYGLHGGQPGSGGINQLWQASTNSTTPMPGSFQIQVQPGDVLQIYTPGGGGWGSTEERQNTRSC